METKNIYGEECPVYYVLNMISGKWWLPILWQLSQSGVMRFSDLKRSVSGITNMMLTNCLQDLENNQIIERKQYAEIPPRVEYRLSERGVLLIETLRDLKQWGEEQSKLLEQDNVTYI